jgi:bifunctional DNA-binding transcriptional regulator/antitoxin component of YhaV-PrlF toxin-antitoxin module
VTIPKQAMIAAGLRAGDRLRAVPRGRGRVLLVREDDPVDRHAGTLTGIYRSGELDDLRDEWR